MNGELGLGEDGSVVIQIVDYKLDFEELEKLARCDDNLGGYYAFRILFGANCLAINFGGGAKVTRVCVHFDYVLA